MAKDKPQPQACPELAEYTTAAQPKAYADGVPVFCAHDAIVPLKDLRPNPKNPNQHPPEQIKLLSSIIRATGWRGPITASPSSPPPTTSSSPKCSLTSTPARSRSCSPATPRRTTGTS